MCILLIIRLKIHTLADGSVNLKSNSYHTYDFMTSRTVESDIEVIDLDDMME